MCTPPLFLPFLFFFYFLTSLWAFLSDTFASFAFNFLSFERDLSLSLSFLDFSVLRLSESAFSGFFLSSFSELIDLSNFDGPLSAIFLVSLSYCASAS